MNVTVLSTDFRPRLGGIAEFSFQVCRELASRGHRLDVVTHALGDAPLEEEMGGFLVHRAFPQPPPYSIYTPRGMIQRPLWSLKSRCRILSFLRGARPDVLLCTNPSHLWLPATRRSRLPYVMVVHGDDIAGDFKKRNPLPAMRMSRLLRAARWTFYNSTYSQRVIETGAKLPGGRSTAVGCGFPVEDISPDGVRDVARRELGWGQEPVVLTVCRLVLRKGVDTTLRALKLVLQRKGDCRYVVLGDGPDRAALEALAAQEGLARHVTFMGRVDEATKLRVYRASDLYVMPSRAGLRGEVEGFGISFLEANAHGLPVIGGRVGGITDSVDDGVNGLLVDPLDVGGLAEAMAALLDDAPRRQRMATAGKDRIRRRYNWPAIVAQVEEKLLAAAGV